MKIFIDTAKLSEINEARSWVIVDGVTTNPTLLREAIEEENKKTGKWTLRATLGKYAKPWARVDI